MWRFAAVLLISLCIGAITFAQSNRPAPTPGKPSQPPQSVAQSGQQQSAPDLRGSENAPVVVKVLPTPKSKEEAAQDKADREDVSAANWWMVRLTGFIGVIGAIQAWVFWRQAGRLKETVGTMREIADKQSNDMDASIKEAARTALAMEKVAEFISISSKAATESVATTKALSRAYLSVTLAGVIPQDLVTKYRFEVRMNLTNTGNTPARNVSYKAVADILPFPLPDGFSFPISSGPITSAGTLGPRQQFILVGIADRLYSDSEITQFKARVGTGLFIYGTVNYEDMTGTARHTNFCQNITWLKDGNNIGFNTKEHNDAD